jgi:hypothetical protein
MNPIREADLVSRIYRLRESGETWEFISSELQWSLSTLSRFRRRVEFVDPRPPVYVVRRRENAERNARMGHVVPADDYVADVMNEMLSLHLRHADIAAHLGVDRDWLRRWVDRHEYVDPRESVDDGELDELMYILSALYPERGEKMMLGFVRARNIKLTREQVNVYIQY